MTRSRYYLIGYLCLTAIITVLAAFHVGSVRVQLTLVPSLIWCALICAAFAGRRWAWIVMSGFTALWALVVVGLSLRSPVNHGMLLLAALVVGQVAVLVYATPRSRRVGG